MKRLCARLQGGPFDGDAGSMKLPAPPARLWAWACDVPGCGQGGIHWGYVPEDVPVRAELYEHHRCTPQGVHVYIWHDVTGGLRDMIETTELVPA